MSSSRQPDMQRAGLGLALALASVGLFAISPSLARLSYEAGAGPLTANVLRGLLMFAMFALILLRPGTPARTPAATRAAPAKRRAAMILIGVSYAAFAWAYQSAIVTVGAGPSLVAANASAILIVLWQARPFGVRRSRHPAGLPELAAACTTVAGVVLLAGDADTSLAGLGLCLLVMVSCGAMTLATEWAAELGVTLAERGCSIGIGMMLLIVALIAGYEDTIQGTGASWWVLSLPAGASGWYAFLGSAAAMIGAISLYSAAIGHIGAVRVSLIANAEPALGLAIAWIIAGEALGLMGILGGILASAGLIDWRKAMALALRPGRSARIIWPAE